MVTEISPITFAYSHTVGRQENRSGNGFFYPVAITRDEDNLLYVVSRGSETPAFFPCKRVTVLNMDEELVREFGTKVPPEEADASAPDGTFMWPTSIALDKEGIAYVADEWLNRISVFDKTGNVLANGEHPENETEKSPILPGWHLMATTGSIWSTARTIAFKYSLKRGNSYPNGALMAAVKASSATLGA